MRIDDYYSLPPFLPCLFVFFFVFVSLSLLWLIEVALSIVFSLPAFHYLSVYLSICLLLVYYCVDSPLSLSFPFMAFPSPPLFSSCFFQRLLPLPSLLASKEKHQSPPHAHTERDVCVEPVGMGAVSPDLSAEKERWAPQALRQRGLEM